MPAVKVGGKQWGRTHDILHPGGCRVALTLPLQRQCCLMNGLQAKSIGAVYQVCRASAKLVPGTQHSGGSAHAHTKHTGASGAEMCGVGPSLGDGLEEAKRA
jgi:hypothetical protein